MRADGYRRRLEKLESSLARFAPGTWAPQELVAAMETGSATPMQLEQVWSIAKVDIRTQIIRIARNRWLYYRAGGTSGYDPTFKPVSRAIETLSHPADVRLDMKPQWVPPYDPEVWSNALGARLHPGYVPPGFIDWARVFLMKRLLGPDGGLGLRQQIGEWIEGGDPPIDVDRFPHESIYWLIDPIDGDPSLLFDARMLRLPTTDLFHRIGNYPSFWGPGQDWTPVDFTGYESMDGGIPWRRARRPAELEMPTQGGTVAPA